MFNKTRKYLLNYPEGWISLWMNINMLIFAIFIGMHLLLHFSTLTVIIVASLLLWIGMGFITAVGLIKALYDKEMKRAKRVVLLVSSTLLLIMIVAGPIMVLLMYYEIIPFPPK